MDDPAAEIRRAWKALAGAGQDAAVEDLLARQAEPHRRYHTAAHVMWVLRHVDDLLAAGDHSDSGQPIDRDVLIAAALFHDAIYDPGSTTNEADSARLAVSRLRSLGWSDGRLGEVGELIEATAGHTASTAAACILLDADLAVLGADPDDYRDYVAGVRFEYSHVPEEQWRVGRAAVVRGFLERPNIFATPWMAARREQRARSNLAAEMRTLAGVRPRSPLD